MLEKAETEARDWCAAAVTRWIVEREERGDVSRETSMGRGAASLVSRETINRIDAWLKQVLSWNRGVQLVGGHEVPRIWRRHVADSLGLAPFVRENQTWVDIGSGGGFPIMPLAIAARTAGLNTRFIAVESDKRKAAFLSVCGAELQPGFDVRSGRIEDQRDICADIVSARALASTAKLCALASSLLQPTGRLLLLKGPGVFEELTEAGRVCHINHKILGHPQGTNSYILIIKGLEHVERSGDGGKP